jgi:amino acid transporter
MKRHTIVTAAVVLISALNSPSVQADNRSAPLNRLVESVGGQREIVWPRWQARVGLAATEAELSRLGTADSGLVLGDYYFARLNLGASSGGLRATGGLLLGASTAARTSALADSSVLRAGRGLNLTFLRSQRSFPYSAPFTEFAPASLGATPYLGVGWSSSSLTGTWGLSADLGFAAGRSAPGGRSLDELLRDLRLAPVMNLGVSYAF